MYDICPKIDQFDPKIQEVFLELEKTRGEFWNLDRASANFLNMLIKAYGSKNALELGTSNGYSAIWLALALRETDGVLTTIEFWDKRQNVAVENFKKCGVDDLITPLLGSAFPVLEKMNTDGKEFDFVFVDANKLEYLKYFKLIHPILVQGGLLLCDNINSHPDKVKPFMDTITGHKDYQNQLLPFPDGLLMSIKKNNTKR